MPGTFTLSFPSGYLTLEGEPPVSCDSDCVTIPIGSSVLVQLGSFTSPAGAVVNSATGYWYLLDPGDESVLYSGTMTYTAASSGDYTGTISAGTTGALENAQSYWVRTTLTDGSTTLTSQLTATAGFPS